MTKRTEHIKKILFKSGVMLISNPIAAFFLDPVIPKLLSLYLSQYLSKWKRNGLLKSYQVEVQRIGRLYYKIGLHALANKKETKDTLTAYISSVIGKVLPRKQ